MGYSGQVATIPLGQMGLMTDLSPVDVALGALILAENISLEQGRIQKAHGDKTWNDVALPAGIVGLFDWRPRLNIQRMIAACENGLLYIDKGIGSHEFKTLAINAQDEDDAPVPLTGLTPNCSFVPGGNETAGRDKKLFFLSRGQNPIQVLVGNTEIFRPITAPANDWSTTNYPRCGIIHKNHFFVFAGQQAYGSDTGDHETFTGPTSLVLPVYPGEGGDIIASYVYKGRLFCFKEDAFGYWLDDSNSDSDLWTWKKITSNFGVSATNAITEAVDDMLSGNDAGTVTSYAATQTLGEVESGDVFRDLQIENFLRGNSSKAGRNVQHALYYAEKKLLFFTYRHGYYTYNNMLVIIDLSKGAPRVHFWYKGRPQCLALRKDALGIKRPMYGSTDGKVYFLDREDRNVGGTAYKGQFQTGQMDFRGLDTGFANRVKLFDTLALTYVPCGNWNLNCDYFIDGKYIDTVQFPMVQFQKPQLDVLHLDQDRLGQPNTETFTRPISGSGRSISFRFWNDGLNQNFQACSITVGFRPAGSQAQKTE